MLIDGGQSSSANNAVVTLLNQKAITTLDVVVLTHPHHDHYTGLTPVFNSFTVKEFWSTGEDRGASRGESTPTTWTTFQTAASNAGAQVTVSQGDKWSSQKARIEILNAGGEYPDTTSGRNINNDSIVMMLYYKSVKVLFTGDIEIAERQDLVDDYCSRSRNRCRKLNSDIVKIPHHGSHHFSPSFVRFADAEHVLVSAGFTNRQHHHPREVALLAYQDFRAEAFYSTSVEADTNLTVTIGPGTDEFSIDGATTGFTYWRDVDPLNPNEQCGVELHGSYCAELWQ
jgi:competence protein ComEC